MSPATIRTRRRFLRAVPSLSVVACVAILGFTSTNPWIGVIATVVLVVMISWRVRVAASTVNEIEAPPTRAVQRFEIIGWAILATLAAAIDVACAMAIAGGGLSAGTIAAVILLCAAFTASAVLDGYYAFTLRTGYVRTAVPGPGAPAAPVV